MLTNVLTNVAVLVWDEVAMFELGVLCEAFGVDRSDDGLPVLDFAICGVEPGQVRTSRCTARSWRRRTTLSTSSSTRA